MTLPRFEERSTGRRLKVMMGLLLTGLFYAQYELSDDNNVVILPNHAVVLGQPTVHVDSFESLMQSNPLAALKEARLRHKQTVHDYSCTFVKQEELQSGMSQEQEINVLYRAEPYSVVMHWVRNPGLAERVIYIKNRWIDDDADTPEEREQAVCQPGPVLRKLLKSIKQPIHGSRAHDASRRYIDEFGFERSLDLLIQYCDLAEKRNELKLEFKGDSYFDGRPTWVLRRSLPYTGKDGEYPDRIAEVHIDKEYRIPTAVYCYSKDEMGPENLLGKYEYRDIRLDVGLTEKEFDPATYGM